MEKEAKKRLRVAVLVSGDPSDIYFANRLIREVNVVGVVIENQHRRLPGAAERFKKLLSFSSNPSRLFSRVRDEMTAKKLGKRARDIASTGFGAEGLSVKAPEGVPVRLTAGVNDINSGENVEFIRGLNPDVIAVCGASILREAIISIPPKGCLNLHGGLSQWYRGVWTTLWAVYNEEPEHIGCTVHFVSQGVDDGDIIYQGRPVIGEDDNHETLYVKVVKLGVRLMITAIGDMEAGTARRHPLPKKGKLYLSKNVTQDVIDEVWRKVDSGFIREHLRRGRRMTDEELGVVGAGPMHAATRSS